MKYFHTLAFIAFAFCTPASAQLLVPQEQVFIPFDAEAEDHLGRSVSVDNGTLVIGVRDDDDACPSDPDCNSGSVHVYVKAGTTWTHEQKIVALDAAAGDDFGESVALWGDTLVVGAPGANSSATNAGAVYIYTRVGTVWTQEGARLVPPELAASDCFGGAVGLEQDLLVGGAAFHDTGLLNGTGSAYVFSRSGTVWTQEAELLASDADQFDQFGKAVAAGTDRVLIGTPRDDDLGTNSGSAYVFARTGTVWAEEAKLNSSNGSGVDAFGTSVSLDLDRIVIGAPFADRTTVTPGSAYVFERTGSNWAEVAILMSIDFSPGDRFGHSVDCNADTIVVGAPMDNHLGVSMGSCYIFERHPTGWVQDHKLNPQVGEVFDEFGQSVATDATSIVVGSWLDEDAAGLHQGSAYAFLIIRDEFKEFCFGDGGDQMGCQNCPCSNNAKPGSLGGCINTFGTSGRLAASGIPSVANDTLRFEATRCSPMSLCILTAADNQLPIMGMCPPGSGVVQITRYDGLRCAGGAFKRHGGRASDSLGNVGITSNGWGGNNGPPIGLIAAGGYMAGATRHFQVIYRDLPSGCGTGLNTSNGVSIQIQP